VCIGGGGRRVLSLAARTADIVSVNATLGAGRLGGAEVARSVLPTAFDEKVAWVRDAAGERFPSIELQCHCPFTVITGDRDAIAAQMAAAFGGDPADALEVPLVLVGSVEQVCDTIEARRERYGFTYWIVADEAMEPMAPVVARLAGG
jgi:hypothetical protein